MENLDEIASFYKCVLCDGELRPEDEEHIACASCDAIYPVIAGIGILVLNPRGLLTAHAAQLSSGTQAPEQSDQLRSLKSAAISSEALARLERSFKVQSANQELGKRFYKPAQEYLERNRKQEELFGAFTSYPMGWPFHNYIPYFYRDWYGTEEAGFVARLFSNAIEDYCYTDKETIAVLGCGASGLLYTVSEFFNRSFGVDLCVPALLVSNHVLNGGEIEIHLNLPHRLFPKVQRRVTLGGQVKKNGITLTAANINNLPFNSSSLSCVTTQYVFDIVNDQKMLASEINRVLAPGGVWINFGIPVGQTLIDLATHLDLPSFFKHTGFDVLDISIQRYKHLDFSELSDWRTTVIHNNAFFVVRKNDAHSYKDFGCFAEYFSNKGESILSQVPKATNNFRISVSDKKEFSTEGVKQKTAIEVETVGGERVAIDVPVEAATFLEQFLQAMDGARSTAQVIDSLRVRYGEAIKEREIIKVLKALCDSSILLFSEDSKATPEP